MMFGAALHRRKEKQSVSNKGAAHGTAKLIALQHGHRQTLLIVEEAVGVEEIVPNVVVTGSVKLVRAALGYYADDAASIAPVLGSVIILQNSKFGNRVGIPVMSSSLCKDMEGAVSPF
jgi:hypothetical protein